MKIPWNVLWIFSQTIFYYMYEHAQSNQLEWPHVRCLARKGWFGGIEISLQTFQASPLNMFTNKLRCYLTWNAAWLSFLMNLLSRGNKFCVFVFPVDFQTSFDEKEDTKKMCFVIQICLKYFHLILEMFLMDPRVRFCYFHFWVLDLVIFFDWSEYNNTNLFK